MEVWQGLLLLNTLKIKGNHAKAGFTLSNPAVGFKIIDIWYAICCLF
jgi:hypothetical protein